MSVKLSQSATQPHSSDQPENVTDSHCPTFKRRQHLVIMARLSYCRFQFFVGTSGQFSECIPCSVSIPPNPIALSGVWTMYSMETFLIYGALVFTGLDIPIYTSLQRRSPGICSSRSPFRTGLRKYSSGSWSKMIYVCYYLQNRNVRPHVKCLSVFVSQFDYSA